MRISEMCEAERPREKMLSCGPKALGNAELLAVLLRTGTKNASAIELAHQLLNRSGGSLLALSEIPLQEMSKTPGVKTGKAVSLAAAFELGRRFMVEYSGVNEIPLTTSAEIYDMMLPRLKGFRHEECWAIFLNQAQYVIKAEKMTSGGGTSTVIDVKDIIRKALECDAKALVLVHNHPSGNPRPGKADIAQTRALKVAASFMELSLLDHVIVCDDSYYSFADERVRRR